MVALKYDVGHTGIKADGRISVALPDLADFLGSHRQRAPGGAVAVQRRHLRAKSRNRPTGTLPLVNLEQVRAPDELGHVTR